MKCKSMLRISCRLAEAGQMATAFKLASGTWFTLLLFFQHLCLNDAKAGSSLEGET